MELEILVTSDAGKARQEAEFCAIPLSVLGAPYLSVECGSKCLYTDRLADSSWCWLSLGRDRPVVASAGRAKVKGY